MRSGTIAALLVVLGALAAAAGCSGSLPALDLPPVRQVGPARRFPELRDYRGVLDCRMRESGLSQAQLADLARDAQLDFVCLGDRARPGSADYGVGGFTGDELIVPGASFAVGGAGGEIVGINLHDPIDMHAPPGTIIEAIHGQDGIAIAASVSRFASPADYALADGIEVYSFERAWAAQNPTALYLRAIFLGAGTFFGRLDTRPDADLAAYDAMAHGARTVLVAGLGRQQNLSVLGARVGTFQQLFEVCTIHALAPQRQVDAIVDALRRGHIYVSFDVLGYVAEFAFYAESAGGKVMMGDDARLSPDTRLKVELPGNADSIDMFADGAKVASTGNAAGMEFHPKAPGAYRIEAYRRARPWILSNPVYLR